jgi:hypothetical protein
MDKFDAPTKTLGYTVLEGDPRYSSFSAEMKFVPVGESSCEAIWTATYEPVGDMGPPEHIKQIVVLVFKTLERAVLSRKTLSHTEVWMPHPTQYGRRASTLTNCYPRRCRNSSLHQLFSKDMVNLGASASSKWVQVWKNALTGFSQATFLHTNY